MLDVDVGLSTGITGVCRVALGKEISWALLYGVGMKVVITWGPTPFNPNPD